MRLNVKALAVSGAALIGGTLLLVAVGNLVFAGYGRGLLELAASVYPGYAGPGGVGSVITLTLYGVMDGAVGGALLGLLYNAALRSGLRNGQRRPA